ncbi:aminoglycoside phosphotransferase family protein [Solihabitans fulvus]|uniref:Aminoglycoside phosphotransferase family protein n=1 Tax=Solihabitans fulvus TaxID=1892852 RepID=A0A5B2WT27_9PSEU|nr:aminoglycoside phosphotransferase family protein [Solihabitans fulvus]KAA2254044.1 aminoglycoside phosphotransferase family protein [Solihabitans fulvus]
MRLRSTRLFGAELRAELGTPTRLRKLPSSPRSRVWRAELNGVPAVIKQVVGGQDPGVRFDREVTALRLAARADPPLVPAILGVDPDRRILVLARVDAQRPPEDWVVDYAAGLARLHATTSAADLGSLPRWTAPGAHDVAAFLDLARALETPVSPKASAELDGLLNRLDRQAGHALLHGDPCYGNDLHTAEGVRFVDFEQASLGNGLTELAYLRIGFPTCWCVTAPTEPLLRKAENAYRDAWRAVTATDLDGDLTDACAGWLIRGSALVERACRDGTDYLARIPHQDWQWGTATARQRLLHRLTVVAQQATPTAELTTVGTLCAAMRDTLLTRWPTLQPLPATRP